MNENLNLVEILKDCPKGTELYSIAYGNVRFEKINEGYCFPILVKAKTNRTESFLADGKMFPNYNGECSLFPSKDQRDWSKFKVNKPKFDPKTLQAFDRVLVRNSNSSCWRCAFYSHQRETEGSNSYRYVTTAGSFICCIPYNEDIKHLVGTNEEATEYYRYWED